MATGSSMQTDEDLVAEELPDSDSDGAQEDDVGPEEAMVPGLDEHFVEEILEDSEATSSEGVTLTASCSSSNSRGRRPAAARRRDEEGVVDQPNIQASAGTAMAAGPSSQTVPVSLAHATASAPFVANLSSGAGTSEGHGQPHVLPEPPQAPPVVASMSCFTEVGISRRTRAQVSLRDVTLDELEELLCEDDDVDPADMAHDELIEYERFLQALQSTDSTALDPGGNARLGGGREGGAPAEEDDDDDEEFMVDLDTLKAIGFLDDDPVEGGGKTKRQRPRPRTRRLRQRAAPLSLIETQAELSVDQLATLHYQVALHVQLLTQMFTLMAKDPAAEAQDFAQQARGMLQELDGERVSHAFQRVGRAAPCFPPDLLLPQALPPELADCGGVSADQPGATLVPLPCVDPRCVLDVAALRLLPSFLMAMDDTPMMEASATAEMLDLESIGAKDRKRKRRKAEHPLQRTMTAVGHPLCIFQGLFDPALSFRPGVMVPRVYWTRTEDQLLALGMRRYGCEWKRVQATYLPCRTSDQVRVRVKNVSALNKAHIVKDVKQQVLGPLTADEVARVARGLRDFASVRNTKARWQRIVDSYLPFRAVMHVQRMWNVITKHGTVPPVLPAGDEWAKAALADSDPGDSQPTSTSQQDTVAVAAPVATASAATAVAASGGLQSSGLPSTSAIPGVGGAGGTQARAAAAQPAAGTTSATPATASSLPEATCLPPAAAVGALAHTATHSSQPGSHATAPCTTTEGPSAARASGDAAVVAAVQGAAPAVPPSNSPEAVPGGTDAPPDDGHPEGSTVAVQHPPGVLETVLPAAAAAAPLPPLLLQRRCILFPLLAFPYHHVVLPPHIPGQPPLAGKKRKRVVPVKSAATATAAAAAAAAQQQQLGVAALSAAAGGTAAGYVAGESAGGTAGPPYEFDGLMGDGASLDAVMGDLAAHGMMAYGDAQQRFSFQDQLLSDCIGMLSNGGTCAGGAAAGGAEPRLDFSGGILGLDPARCGVGNGLQLLSAPHQLVTDMRGPSTSGRFVPPVLPVPPAQQPRCDAELADRVRPAVLQDDVMQLRPSAPHANGQNNGTGISDGTVGPGDRSTLQDRTAGPGGGSTVLGDTAVRGGGAGGLTLLGMGQEDTLDAFILKSLLGQGTCSNTFRDTGNSRDGFSRQYGNAGSQDGVSFNRLLGEGGSSGFSQELSKRTLRPVAVRPAVAIGGGAAGSTAGSLPSVLPAGSTLRLDHMPTHAFDTASIDALLSFGTDGCGTVSAVSTAPHGATATHVATIRQTPRNASDAAAAGGTNGAAAASFRPSAFREVAPRDITQPPMGHNNVGGDGNGGCSDVGSMLLATPPPLSITLPHGLSSLGGGNSLFASLAGGSRDPQASRDAFARFLHNLGGPDTTTLMGGALMGGTDIVSRLGDDVGGDVSPTANRHRPTTFPSIALPPRVLQNSDSVGGAMAHQKPGMAELPAAGCLDALRPAAPRPLERLPKDGAAQADKDREAPEADGGGAKTDDEPKTDDEQLAVGEAEAALALHHMRASPPLFHKRRSRAAGRRDYPANALISPASALSSPAKAVSSPGVAHPDPARHLSNGGATTTSNKAPPLPPAEHVRIIQSWAAAATAPSNTQQKAAAQQAEGNATGGGCSPSRRRHVAVTADPGRGRSGWHVAAGGKLPESSLGSLSDATLPLPHGTDVPPLTVVAGGAAAVAGDGALATATSPFAASTSHPRSGAPQQPTVDTARSGGGSDDDNNIMQAGGGHLRALRPRSSKHSALATASVSSVGGATRGRLRAPSRLQHCEPATATAAAAGVSTIDAAPGAQQQSCCAQTAPSGLPMSVRGGSGASASHTSPHQTRAATAAVTSARSSPSPESSRGIHVSSAIHQPAVAAHAAAGTGASSEKVSPRCCCPAIKAVRSPLRPAKATATASPGKGHKEWTRADDKLLLDTILSAGGGTDGVLPFKEAAARLGGGRSVEAVQARYRDLTAHALQQLLANYA